jgi:hypothetical protein
LTVKATLFPDYYMKRSAPVSSYHFKNLPFPKYWQIILLGSKVSE